MKLHILLSVSALLAGGLWGLQSERLIVAVQENTLQVRRLEIETRTSRLIAQSGNQASRERLSDVHSTLLDIEQLLISNTQKTARARTINADAQMEQYFRKLPTHPPLIHIP